MKKIYTAPLATEVNIEASNMLATSINIGDGTLTPDQAWTNRYDRGEWGNLWKK